MISSEIVSKKTQSDMGKFRNRIINPIEFRVPLKPPYDMTLLLEYIRFTKEEKITIVRDESIVIKNQVDIYNPETQRKITYITDVDNVFSSAIILSSMHFSGFPPRISDEEKEKIKEITIDKEYTILADGLCLSCVYTMHLFSVMASLNNHLKITFWDKKIPYDRPHHDTIGLSPVIIKGKEIRNRVFLDDAITAVNYLNAY